MRSTLLSAIIPLLAACGPNIYRDALPGRFDGNIYLMWINDGNGSAGDGTFLFVPVPGQELTFYRTNPDATVSRIRPEMMYTDGGSIPRIAQVFKGFSPWGYAPAYMVHDWLFLAKNCATDGKAKGRERDIAKMEFPESAMIMAEAIRTLVDERKVKRNDVSESLIPSAVGGAISERLWTQHGACEARRVKPEDEAAVDARLRGSANSLQGMTRRLKDGRVVPVQPAQIVTTLSF